MALPSIFPLYPDSVNGPYNVSLALPGPISEISKSIGLTSSSILLVPNSQYLQKFIEGDIGIGDSILKGMMLQGFNSPSVASSEEVFKKFAKLNKIDLGDDISKFKKNGKLVMPKEKITVSKEWDNIGLKSIEKTTLQSIFETQKPYIEIAKLVIENLSKIEDIIARVMPIISVSPLTCLSKKPNSNGGNNQFPRALGFNNGESLVGELSRIESLLSASKKSQEPKTDGQTSQPAEDGRWQIISTIYSTGEFDPNVEYQYFYKDLPADDVNIPQKKSDLNTSAEKDPYHAYKPKKLIFGIYNSSGQPINPTQTLTTIGLSGTNVINVPTPFKKADWILRSPKWFLPSGVYQWPTYGQPIFIWEKGGQTRESKSNPNPDADPAWRVKKYKEGDKDLITKDDAIPGNPIIVRFESSDETEYRNIFTDFVKFSFYKTDIPKEEKDTYTNEIIGKLDIQSHLQNVFNYGQLSSSFYKRINNEDPVPALLKRSFKPYKIFSPNAANDEQIRNYSIANGLQPGFIWIEPEADYDLKLIRVDPTTNINYVTAQGEPEISTQIQSFVKNRFTIRFSNNIQFSISVSKNGSDPEIIENITEYSLENWNYSNSEVINSNQFTYTIWSNTPPQEYVNQVVTTKEISGHSYELSKNGSDYYYRKYKLGEFNTKQYEYIPAGDTTIFTDSDEASFIKPVRIDENGKITRWYYLKDRLLTGPSSKQSGTRFIQSDETNYLPTFGVERIFTLNYQYKTTNADRNHQISYVDSDFTLYKIKVSDNNPFGSIIDPSKITNDQLATSNVFSTGRYGHGSPDDPQEIEIIKRYKLTDRDTESYYIVEGILRNPPPGDDVAPQSIASNSYYRISDSIGALKVFLNVLVDIFSKLIPQINKLLKLFKNPTNFVVDIISEKLGENVLFLNKESMQTYSDAFKKVREIKKTPDKKLPPEEIDLTGNVKYKVSAVNSERVKNVKELKNLFKNSNLSNYVYVDDDGKIISVLDGMSTIPFGIFGINLPFGMKLDTNEIAEGRSPLKLIFEKDFKLKNIKDLSDELNLKKYDETQPNTKEFVQPPTNISEENVYIKFSDGSNRTLPENSLDEFILNNKTKYNFIYLEEDTQQSIQEADKLAQSGSQEDLQKAVDKLNKASRSRPNDNFLKSKIDELNKKLEKLKTSQQPMLKMILGLVTLPIKMISSIIEWLLNFFKSLSNPLTLPKKVVELLSFDWIMKFFTPMGILEMAGIKFKPEKRIEWVSKVMAKGPGKPNLPKSLRLPEDLKNRGFNKEKIKSGNYLLDDDAKVIDLSLFFNVAFAVKLPTYTPLQFRQNMKLPSPLLSAPGGGGFLCLIEKVINAIIDFIWSTLGIESVVKPPHIKLCDKKSSDDSSDFSSEAENTSQILSGNNNADLEEFYYEVKLENGQILKFMNREELDKFISDNIEYNYDFNF